MEVQMKEKGVILPIFSLPSKYGIGDFGKEAYEFIDILSNNNIQYWEILPINACNKLPYSPISYYALNEEYISLDKLKEKGLINNPQERAKEDCVHYDNFKENHPITLTIVHKFREMGISLKTDNSESCSKTASIHQDGQKTVITYTFENTGSVNVGLNMHIGTCIITLLNGDVKGMYYTHPDRGRYGEIIAHKEKIVK